IGYLTRGRDLLRLQGGRERKSPPLVLADPDLEKATQLTMPHLPVPTPASGGSKQQVKGESARDVFKEFIFPPLFYTAKEGQALQTLLPNATLLTKRRATKAALSQIYSPQLLHVATHGFFLEDFKLTPAGGGRPLAAGDDPDRALKTIGIKGLPL